MFDTHEPVLIDLDVGQNHSYEWRLPMPKSFMELPINHDHMHQGYQQVTQQHGHPITIEEWGEAIETAVDFAYRTTQTEEKQCPWHATSGLPKAYRGRCMPKLPKKVPLRSLYKPGRSGDYNPNCEVHSHNAANKIKQVRIDSCLLKEDSQSLTSRTDSSAFCNRSGQHV